MRRERGSREGIRVEKERVEGGASRERESREGVRAEKRE